MLLCNYLPYTVRIVKRQFTGFCAVSYVPERMVDIENTIIDDAAITAQHQIMIEWNDVTVDIFNKYNVFQKKMIEYDHSYKVWQLKQLNVDNSKENQDLMISIYECLDYFQNNEIDDVCINNAGHDCKQIGRKIISLPNILIMCWKDDNVFDQIINYPIFNLDLSDFEGGNKCIYDLYGGIYFDKHLNNTIYSIVKNLKNDKWYYYRDEFVKQITEQELLDQFYVKALFYMRKSELRVQMV